MAQEFAKVFYNSRKWIKARNSYIEERVMVDGGMCEECHNKLGYIVHHKILLTPENINNPEISLNHDYFEYVCKACHDLFEGHGSNGNRVRALCVFDKNGQPISLREIDRREKLVVPPKNEGGK